MPLLIPLLVLGLVAMLATAISRGNELFLLSVRAGKLLLIRGRIPIALRQDIDDVMSRSGVQEASIRAVRSSGHARLLMRGVDEGTAQRLRNTLGVHPIHKLRSAPMMADRNLGQLLGLTWLAWMLRRR